VRPALEQWASMLSRHPPLPQQPGQRCIDGQPTPWVLLGLIFVDVGDFEIGRPLDGPEARGERGDPARILLSMIMSSISGRGASIRSPRLSPGRTVG
jgi:hypothetical protein